MVERVLSRVSDNGDEVCEDTAAEGGTSEATAAQLANMIEMKSIIETLMREKDALERTVDSLSRANDTLRLEEEARKEEVSSPLPSLPHVTICYHMLPYVTSDLLGVPTQRAEEQRPQQVSGTGHCPGPSVH